jgi:hypothetical protein
MKRLTFAAVATATAFAAGSEPSLEGIGKATTEQFDEVN